MSDQLCGKNEQKLQVQSMGYNTKGAVFEESEKRKHLGCLSGINPWCMWVVKPWNIVKASKFLLR